MSQSKNKETDNRSAKKVPVSKTAEKEPPRKRTGLLITLLVILVIGAIAGVSIYWIQVRPFQQTIIVVDDTSINMRYFLKRTRMAGSDPMAMLLTLTNELMIKKAAPQSPYNIKVTPEDIDETLREIVRGESGTISDSEFGEWYRQQLNESGLSDAEYRDLIYTGLLRFRLHIYLAERVPTVAEQVYLHSTILDTEEMGEIMKRYGEGEDLDAIVKEVWLDKESNGEIEDVGWFPRGALPDSIARAAFNSDLNIGEVSQPVAISQAETAEVIYSLIMVSEKADAREVNEDALAILKSKVLEDWLISEMQLHKVEFHGFDKSKTTGENVFGSETYAWINWQLSRMRD